MSKKATDIVGYITPLGFLIAFLLGTRQESRFHLNQSLVIIIVEIIVEILDRILGKIPLVGIITSIIFGVISLVVFIVWIIALVGAIRGEEKPMPILSGIKLI